MSSSRFFLRGVEERDLHAFATLDRKDADAWPSGLIAQRSI
jgi:hypothetical protein